MMANGYRQKKLEIVSAKLWKHHVITALAGMVEFGTVVDEKACGDGCTLCPNKNQMAR
ncbi:MAG: hypothetical protein ACLRUL_10695 [Clostridia bacterium]